jgi:hypothetical protein
MRRSRSKAIDFTSFIATVVHSLQIMSCGSLEPRLRESFSIRTGQPLQLQEVVMRMVFSVPLALVLVVAGVSRAEDTYKPDEEGFIRNWLILAPLPFGAAQNGAEALGKEQVPNEAQLQPKEGDKAKAGDKEIAWKAYKADSHLVDFNGFLGQQTEDSVGYAVCYVHADEEMADLSMKTGSDDQCKVYLNGKEVFKNEEPRSTDKDQDSTKVTLKKGVNVVVFKVVNEKVDWSGCMRFTDKDGKPITNLKVSLQP